MKLFTRKDKRTKLEKEIDLVLDEMSSVNSDTEKYTTMAKNLETLNRIKNERKVKPETYINGIVYFGGLCLILGFEKANIITSKALGFVIKGRV